MEPNPVATEQAVQLVEFEEGTNKPIFFPDRLKRTLKNIEHLPLIVFSIAGMARTGKSFMMNLFVCYLTYVEKYGTDDGWKQSTDLVSGVNWARSNSTVTLGIWMWNRPFILTKENAKVAVLLLDTQGSGDNRRSDIKLETLITKISLQLTTVQIININLRLRLEELTNLQVSEHFKIETDREKSQFQSILFLIRNEQCRSLGENPGIIDEIIEEADGVIAREAAEQVKASCSEVTSFCLPYPGTMIARASVSDQIRLCDIPDDFKDHVFALCQKMFDLTSILSTFKLKDGRHFQQIFEWLKGCCESESVSTISTPSESLIRSVYMEMIRCYESFIDDILDTLRQFDTKLADEKFGTKFEPVLNLCYHMLNIHMNPDNSKKQEIQQLYEDYEKTELGNDSGLSALIEATFNGYNFESDPGSTKYRACVKLYEDRLVETMEEIRNLEKKGLPAHKISSLQSLADKARLEGSGSLHTLLTHRMSLQERRKKDLMRHLKQTDRPNEKLVLQNDQGKETSFSIPSNEVTLQKIEDLSQQSTFYIIPHHQSKVKSYAIVLYITKNRDGAAEEAWKLIRAFEDLGLTVFTHSSEDANVLFEALEYRLDQIKEECCFLIVSVMSHGNEGNITSNGSQCKINDCLTEVELTISAKIPVVFIIQGCQRTKAGSDSIKLKRSHTVVCMATVQGETARRGVFTGAIADHLGAIPANRSQNIHEIYTKAVHAMTSQGHKVQKPIMYHTLQKHLMIARVTGPDTQPE